MGICKSANKKKPKPKPNGEIKSTNKNKKKTKPQGDININNIINYNDNNANSTRNYPISNRETTNYNLYNNFSNLRTTYYEKGEIYFIRKKDLNINNNNDNDDPRMNIDLFLSLENLQNSTYLYSIKLSICNNKLINQYTYLGQTEESNGNEIVFGSHFGINYYFEKEQILKGSLLENKIVISNFNITLGQIMGSKGLTKKIMLKNPKDDSKICDLIFEVKKTGENEVLSFSLFKVALKLNKKNSFSNKTNVFYVIKSFNDGKNWRPLYKSNETDVYCNSEFIFNEIKLETYLKDMKINFELYNSFNCELIGNAISNTNELLNNSQQNKLTTLEIDDENNQPVGIFNINYNMMRKFSFIDYLKCGMQINMEIAIDYTSSNGPPSHPTSLHYMNGNCPNDYEKAISSCCSIVSNYDDDQIFPLYGFGGIPPNNNNKVSHCFNVNLKDNPDIEGLNNIIPIYKKSLEIIKLSGPTYFAPVIKSIYNKLVNNRNDPDYINHYFILMILTDGIINDMDETSDILVECAYVPLSVIIIGIGDANFENMDTLDGDYVILTNTKGEKTKRDLVQFVEFNKFKNFIDHSNTNKDLAEEVLKEIPRQVEEYYELMNDFRFNYDNRNNNNAINQTNYPVYNNNINNNFSSFNGNQIQNPKMNFNSHLFNYNSNNQSNLNNLYNNNKINNFNSNNNNFY